MTYTDNISSVCAVENKHERKLIPTIFITCYKPEQVNHDKILIESQLSGCISAKKNLISDIEIKFKQQFVK